MITEDYVSYNVAKLLKEKGFDGFCGAYYDNFTINNFHNGCEPTDFNGIDTNIRDIVSAPTLQMAMKWLREEHNLFVEIQYATALLLQPHTTIYFQIYYMSLDYTTSGKNMLPDDYIREYYTSYEEACEAAISYCLKNLI